jgi:hypothetical protein
MMATMKSDGTATSYPVAPLWSLANNSSLLLKVSIATFTPSRRSNS